MEAQTARDAETAARAAAVARAERARSVLEQRHVGQIVQRQRPPEEVHAEEQLRARPDANLRRVDVHRLRIDVDEHRLQPGERDDVGRRRERVRGHDHLVARLEPGGEHGEVERGSARGDGQGVLDLAEPRDLGLELEHLRAHREHPALEDLGHLGELLLAEVGPPAARTASLNCDAVFLPVPSDRLLEALVELHLRLPAENLAGLLHVRDAQLDVGVVQRLEDDLSRRAADALDALREVEDRHGAARVADVERLTDRCRMLEAQQNAARPCRSRTSTRGSASRRRGSSGRGRRATPR